MHTYANTCTHTYAHIHTCTRTYTRIHTHIDKTHAHARTHTPHTHLHVLMSYPNECMLSFNFNEVIHVYAYLVQFGVVQKN